jgi:HEAT repeat protein
MSLLRPPNIEKLKAKGDIKGLIKALDYTKDETILECAVEALVRIGEPAVNPLIKAATGWKVNSSAIHVLDRMGEQEAVMTAVKDVLDRFLGYDLVYPELGFGDDDKQNDARVLVEIGTPVVESLAKALNDPQMNHTVKTDRIRCGIQTYYGRFITSEGMFVMLEKLQARIREGVSLRVLAAGVLGEIGDNRAVEPLVELVKSQDDLTRWVTAGALISIGDPRAIESLLKYLSDDDWFISARGLEWGLIGNGQLIKPLLADFKAGKREVIDQLEILGWGKATLP